MHDVRARLRRWLPRAVVAGVGAFGPLLSAQAQEPPASVGRGAVVFGLGAARAGDLTGVSVDLGLGLRLPHLLLSAGVEAVIAPPDADGRYRREWISSGVEACRDRQTGLFVDSYLCADRVQAAAVLEAAALLPPQLPLLIGAGLRAGPSGGPYAVVGYTRYTRSEERGWFAMLRAGPDLRQFRLGAIMALHSRRSAAP